MPGEVNTAHLRALLKHASKARLMWRKRRKVLLTLLPWSNLAVVHSADRELYYINEVARLTRQLRAAL